MKLCWLSDILAAKGTSAGNPPFGVAHSVQSPGGGSKPVKPACFVLLMTALIFFPKVVSAQKFAPPIKAGANNRYLIDQNGTPFLLMGDSVWSMVQNLPASQMASYMSTRQSQGFNAFLVDVICGFCYSSTSGNGAANDGTLPFTSGTSFANYDISTPNPAYFAEVDAMVNLAKTYNLIVLLDPIDNYNFMATLENNGATKAFNYGAYLGNRYKNFTNIIWFTGNDFQDWNSNSTDNNLALQVMSGIKSADPNHLQTIELNYNFSYSNQDTTLSPVLTLDMAYTYGGTYDEVLQAYNSSPTLPVFMGESNYEGEDDTGGLHAPCGVYCLREEEYWTLTSGASGQLYGAANVYQFRSGWSSDLNDPGAGEIKYLTGFFSPLPWWTLVPDQTHQIVTAGYGKYDASSLNITTNNYCTTSWVTDGSLAAVYCPGNTNPPSAFTLTVDLAKFSGPVSAQWFDPSNGTYSAVSGSPFNNSGSQNFSPASLNNHDGNPDWVLLLTTSPRPLPPTKLTATVQ
jgi:hypothetical protein